MSSVAGGGSSVQINPHGDEPCPAHPGSPMLPGVTAAFATAPDSSRPSVLPVSISLFPLPPHPQTARGTARQFDKADLDVHGIVGGKLPGHYILV